MAHKLSWSPTARHDLRDLLAYISEDDLEAARKFAQGIFETTRRPYQDPCFLPGLGRLGQVLT